MGGGVYKLGKDELHRPCGCLNSKSYLKTMSIAKRVSKLSDDPYFHMTTAKVFRQVLARHGSHGDSSGFACREGYLSSLS